MSDLEETQFECPTCSAVFARPYQHCQECGRHYRGEHECEGSVDWTARRENARAFIGQELKKGKHWTSLPYDFHLT